MQRAVYEHCVFDLTVEVSSCGSRVSNAVLFVRLDLLRASISSFTIFSSISELYRLGLWADAEYQ